MLDQWLAQTPKWVIAMIVIAIGFVVIVISDPPHTACDSQLELFKQGQQEFLYFTHGARNAQEPALIGQMYQRCLTSNSPGACFEYFERLKRLAAEMDALPRQCSETVAADDTLKKWVFGSMTLMAQISWGERGPASVVHGNAWFDASDLAMFCGLKRGATQIYGIEAMDKWREKVLAGLPEGEKMDHETLYQKSLLSTQCEAYR